VWGPASASRIAAALVVAAVFVVALLLRGLSPTTERA
jgi:hypothetical protein